MLRKPVITLTAFASLLLANSRAGEIPTPTPSPTPPQIVIQNNITIPNTITITAPTPAPTPPPQVIVVTPVSPSTHDYDFIVDVFNHYNNHDAAWITTYTQSGFTNYFGKRGTSNRAIASDMYSDARTYGEWRGTWYPESFYRDVEGSMIYDNLTIDSSIYERGVRWHNARVRFTVGYTYIGGEVKIYALVQKVLPR